MPAFLCISSR